MVLSSPVPVGELAGRKIQDMTVYDTAGCLKVNEEKISLRVNQPFHEGPDEGSVRKLIILITNEPRHEKTNVLVSDMVRHKPGCTTTQDG